MTSAECSNERRTAISATTANTATASDAYPASVVHAMCRKRRVSTVSRSRIAEAVWNYKFDSETNVVDVYINYLRKKLSFGGRSAPIRTVRGVGYRLEAS